MKKDYINQYRILHQNKKHYGMTSIKFYDQLLDIIKVNNFEKILDYGCGKSSLLDNIQDALNIKAFKYDPAIDMYSKLPNIKMDFVICTDVLQHVPLYDLDRVLTEISSFSKNAFFNIRFTPYKTVLPNGEPANCTIYPPQWWKSMLEKYYNRIEIVKSEDKNSVTFITI